MTTALGVPFRARGVPVMKSPPWLTSAMLVSTLAFAAAPPPSRAEKQNVYTLYSNSCTPVVCGAGKGMSLHGS